MFAVFYSNIWFGQCFIVISEFYGVYYKETLEKWNITITIIEKFHQIKDCKNELLS